jgi:hypothetical protein
MQPRSRGAIRRGNCNRRPGLEPGPITPGVGNRRVGKGALAPCPPSSVVPVIGGHAEPVIGRAFARPVGFAHPTKPNMTSRSRDTMRPRFEINSAPKKKEGARDPPKKRARGRPGARCTRGLVCKLHKKTHTSIQVQRRQSGLPCAMVLRLISCSPR